MIKIEIIDDVAIIHRPFPFRFLQAINALSGRKVWGDGHVSIQATPANMRLLKESAPELQIIDNANKLDDQAAFEQLPTQHAKAELPDVGYRPAMELYQHQKHALALSWDREAYALLFDMGLGKSAILIANAGMLYQAGKIKGCIIVAPKGVHRQWVEQEIPKHLDSSIQHHIWLWKGKTIRFRIEEGLQFLAMNTDSLRTHQGQQTAMTFLELLGRKVMMVADESHNFKTYGTQRTRALLNFRPLVPYRRIATGTPIAKNIIDAWTQFMFLDQRILGHRYLSSFRSRYCIMGGWEGRQIIGQRNTEEFYSLIAPHSYRLTKAEALDLPEKIYVAREYEMSETTHKAYKEMKDTLMVQFNDGTIADAQNAAVAMLRLQQIVCGSLPNEEGETKETGKERIEELLEIVRQVEGPVVVWARFIDNIKAIEAALNEEDDGRVVTYYGATGNKERQVAVEDFVLGRARYFVSNPAAGGVGLNLQGDCRNVVYFSNSFNYVERQQSEDRVHRIGTKGSVTYFDLVARRSVDRAILRSLRNKRDIATLTLDEIRMAVKEDA